MSDSENIRRRRAELRQQADLAQQEAQRVESLRQESLKRLWRLHSRVHALMEAESETRKNFRCDRSDNRFAIDLRWSRDKDDADYPGSYWRRIFSIGVGQDAKFYDGDTPVLLDEPKIIDDLTMTISHWIEYTHPELVRLRAQSIGSVIALALLAVIFFGGLAWTLYRFWVD